MAFTTKKNYIRLVLDESVLYLGNTNGTIVVRGEVIVNFIKDTAIQGPIDLLFEGLQRFYPWRGMKLYILHFLLCFTAI